MQALRDTDLGDLRHLRMLYEGQGGGQVLGIGLVCPSPSYPLVPSCDQVLGGDEVHARAQVCASMR